MKLHATRGQDVGNASGNGSGVPSRLIRFGSRSRKISSRTCHAVPKGGQLLFQIQVEGTLTLRVNKSARAEADSNLTGSGRRGPPRW